MAHAKIQVKSRSEIGHTARKLRRQGIIPAVIYGKNTKPVAIKLGFGEFIRAFKEAGRTHVIDVVVDDSKKALPCIIHDMDIDPVSSRPRHVDFLSVNLKEKVVATVPLNFTNESSAAKQYGAVLSTLMDDIEVSALPDNIPDHIDVDLSVITELSDVIRVGDLPKSDTFEILTDPEAVLVTLIAQSTDEITETSQAIEGGDSTTAGSEESKG
jgi:large subunit ribosomal protein L25